MALLDNVLAEMSAAGMPPMPAGHPKTDGKEHRYGPQKKAWYKLTEKGQRDGQTIVYGAYGRWRGDDNGAVGVTLGDDEVSKEDIADVRKRMEEAAAKEEADRRKRAELAANRAKGQWEAAGEDGVSPYLVRKQITPERCRIDADGNLLVPLKKYSIADGTRLIGLQKIAPDGGKRFNKGMDKVGSACLLGAINAETQLVIFGEGYATARTIRMDIEEAFPVMVTVDAGNIMEVAKRLRADFPALPFLFAADDDWLLCKRLAKRLVKDFGIASTLVIDGTPWPLVEADFIDDDELDKGLRDRLVLAVASESSIAINGMEHVLKSAAGDDVRVTAWWRKDGCGVDYIEADVRTSRVMQTYRLENAGRAKAAAAAKEVGNAAVTFPVFADRGFNKWTDYSDLHLQESPLAVRMQLFAAIESLMGAARGEDMVPAAEQAASGSDIAAPSLIEVGAAHQVVVAGQGDDPPPAPEHPVDGQDAKPKLSLVKGGAEQAASPPADGAGAGAGGKKPPKKVYPPSFWDKVDYLLENFVLIYGTDDVWDQQKRMILKIGHMRLAHGSDPVKFWLNNESRRMVNKDQVVFDPTLSCDPDTSVNLYHGITMQPKQGECNLILELISHLCSDNEEWLDWVLKWIAYPLQNKGAKMRTSVIIHGDEGSGKNLFWENVIKRIYGEYGGVIGNAQIESQFNEWASKKLFFVADEVVTRNELRQLKGRLKQMITGETININPKNMTERTEANHMNFVFLSNELQPLALDKTDRRYMVLWTPPNKPASFYKETFEQIENGGAEAFYAFLLQLDLGDFTEHTKPLMTKAKHDLINLGLSTPEKFYREWSRGFLPLPFMCCSAQQLYLGYQRWSHLNGEKFPATQTFFGRTIDRIGRGEVQRATVKYELGEVAKQRTVYKVGALPEGVTINEWVGAASQLFEKELRRYRHVHDQPTDLESDVHGDVNG
jgi:phage/plasmid primase-like uncharacterized protein